MIGVAICCFSSGTKRLQGKRLRVVECFLKVMEKRELLAFLLLFFILFAPLSQ